MKKVIISNRVNWRLRELFPNDEKYDELFDLLYLYEDAEADIMKSVYAYDLYDFIHELLEHYSLDKYKVDKFIFKDNILELKVKEDRNA